MMFSRARVVGELGRAELMKEGAYLLPLRLFIGLGWLRTGVEKLIDPAWHSGAKLTSFLSGQLEQGHVVFPWYRQLVEQTFLPNAALLSLIVLLGELLCGIAIMAGCCTNGALLGGLFMNANFLLAGVPDPSAFYIVIQVLLIAGAAGAICGADTLLQRRVAWPLLIAHDRASRRAGRRRDLLLLLLTALALLSSIYASFYIQTLDPGRSVKDPAMIIVILSLVGASFGAIGVMRERERHAELRDVAPRPDAALASRMAALDQPGPAQQRAATSPQPRLSKIRLAARRQEEP
jgi:thiosulfate dehydrogenase (quinone) large subunit